MTTVGVQHAFFVVTGSPDLAAMTIGDWPALNMDMLTAMLPRMRATGRPTVWLKRLGARRFPTGECVYSMRDWEGRYYVRVVRGEREEWLGWEMTLRGTVSLLIAFWRLRRAHSG